MPVRVGFMVFKTTFENSEPRPNPYTGIQPTSVTQADHNECFNGGVLVVLMGGFILFHCVGCFLWWLFFVCLAVVVCLFVSVQKRESL